MNIGAGTVTHASGAIVSAGYAIDQSFLNRINNTPTGVLSVAANSANNLDLNTPGLTNVSLGATAPATYSGGLSPAGNSSRLGGGGSTLTVSSSLTGAGNAVLVRDS